MKKSILLFLAFLFISNLSISQTNWVNKTTYNVKDYKNFKDLKFIDDNTGYTSYINNIYKSTDGGLNWQIILPAAFDTISAVYYYDQNIIFASYGNKLFRTTNSGNSWNLMYTFSLKPLKIFFDNILTGFINDSTYCYKTSDGGKTWDNFPYPNGSQNQSPYFINASKILSYSNDLNEPYPSLIYKSENGGLNWSTSLNITNYDNSKPLKLKFSGVNKGILVTGKLNLVNNVYVTVATDLFKTIDGGNNWTRQSVNILPFVDFSFSNENSIDILTKDNILHHSSNGGSSFNNIYYNAILMNVTKNNFGTSGYLCGEYNALYKSVDPEQPYFDISSVSSSHWNLNSISFLNSQTGFAVGEKGTFLKTTNGGDNFFCLTNQNGVYNDTNNYNYIKFFNQNEGVIGSNYLLKKTTDQGSTWNSIYLPLSSLVNRVDFYDLEHGLIRMQTAYNLSRIYYTSDGGLTWKTVRDDVYQSYGGYGFSSDYFQNFFLTSNNIYLTESSSSFTYCGHTCWSSSSSNRILYRNLQDSIFNAGPSGNPAGNIRLIKSADDQIIFSTTGQLSYTTDNGNLWINTINTMPTYSYGVGNNTYYSLNQFVSTQENQIFSYLFQKSYNVGNTWQGSELIYSFSPRQLYFVNDRLGFIIGNGGMILKTNNGGGLVGINNNSNFTSLPDKFILDQNYPNPFNPVTKINFSIPVSSRITLKVYDVLGREVAALINSELRTAGNYSVSFDGSKLSSGVYFYKLMNESNAYQSITKRMVLIK